MLKASLNQLMLNVRMAGRVTQMVTCLTEDQEVGSILSLATHLQKLVMKYLQSDSRWAVVSYWQKYRH